MIRAEMLKSRRLPIVLSQVEGKTGGDSIYGERLLTVFDDSYDLTEITEMLKVPAKLQVEITRRFFVFR